MTEVDSLTEKLTLDGDGNPFAAHSLIHVSLPWEQKPGKLGPPRLPVTAIWDTGASHTSFTRTLIKKLQLIRTGDGFYHTSKGKRKTTYYGANIYLSHKLQFPVWEVMEANIRGGDVLLGMDIIGKGDFAISNYPGEPIFSFRYPSQDKISFAGNSNVNRPWSP